MISFDLVIRRVLAADLFEIYLNVRNYNNFDKLFVKHISINNEKPIVFAEGKAQRFNFYHTVFKKKKWSDVKSISILIETEKKNLKQYNTFQLIKTNQNISVKEQPVIFNENNELKISIPEIYHFEISAENAIPKKYYKDIIIKRKKLSNTKKQSSIASMYVIQDKKVFNEENQLSELLDNIIDEKIKRTIKINQELPVFHLNKLITTKKDKDTENNLECISHDLFNKEIISNEKKSYDFEEKTFKIAHEQNTDVGIMIPYHYYGNYTGKFEFEYKVNDKKSIKLDLNFLDNVQKPLLHVNYGIIKLDLVEREETRYKPIQNFKYHLTNKDVLNILVLKEKMQLLDLNKFLSS